MSQFVLTSPARRLAAAVAAVAAGAALALSGAHSPSSGGSLPIPVPFANDAAQVASGVVPPTQAMCNAIGRRCFNPTSMRNSYDIGPLLAAGDDGRGKTIAIIDSFGYPSAGSDLENFSQQFGLPLMCGMPNVTCKPGMPTFEWDQWDGQRPVKQPPSGSQGTGQQNSNGWALEVALDTQWAHATAPGANIILMTTNTAETQGVPGLPQMMDAEQFLVDNHLADVVSQSFGTAEPDFQGGIAAIQPLRHAYISGAAAGVTFLASSGDSGSDGSSKTPIKNPAALDTANVGYPASDPLVTAVGGTYLCTDAVTGTTVDSTSPGGRCRSFPGVREVGWTFSGGGFSSIFSRPSYQNTLPAGSTPIGAMRGVPDIAYQASSGTGALIYVTAPGLAGTTNVNDGSWYVIGGTSSSCPQWAGLVAIADQMAGHDLGLIQPKLYSLANGPNYSQYFFDVTTGNNTISSTVPGYPATTGWDPVTGLGTPDAAKLVPALAS